MKQKKCISPVVATALLLVVAVVAVVGFQTWYQTYQSNIFTNTESQSQTSTQAQIETLVGTNLYVKGGMNTSIKKITIDGNECNFKGNISGMENIDVSDCLVGVKSKTPEILIQTDDKILSKQIYLKSDTVNVYPDCKLGGEIISNGTTVTKYKYSMPYNNLNGCSDISQTRTCTNGVLSGSNEFDTANCEDSLAPSTSNGEWVLVFGNSDLGTTDFYVMKYEAKKDISNNPISEAIGDPWTSITQTTSRTECSDLGSGYSLITDPQWVTMGRDIEAQSVNWNTGIVGNGYLARGWTANTAYGDSWTNSAVASSTGSSCLYNTGADSCSSTGEHLYKRTLSLSSGEELWDMSGNVWEWTNDTLNEPNSGLELITNNEGWFEWNNIDNIYNYLTSNISTYNSTNAIGQVYVDNNGAYPSGTIHSFIRGGNWNTGSYGGLLSLSLYNSPSGQHTGVGFRCSYQPQ